MKTDLFVTGTDTGVGKTLVSAVLVAALGRKYWKPIQTGASEGTDRETVMKWARISKSETHPEALLFDPPVSPHLAAERQGMVIDIMGIRRPDDPEPIVAEGAGGVYVPINDEVFMLDLIGHLNMPVVIAARSTLGTINHTLLTIAAVRSAGVEMRGVVMAGKEDRDNRRAIEHYGDVRVIGAVPWLETIDRGTLRDVFDRYFDRTAFE